MRRNLGVYSYALSAICECESVLNLCCIECGSLPTLFAISQLFLNILFLEYVVLVCHAEISVFSSELET